MGQHGTRDQAYLHMLSSKPATRLKDTGIHCTIIEIFPASESWLKSSKPEWKLVPISSTRIGCDSCN